MLSKSPLCFVRDFVQDRAGSFRRKREMNLIFTILIEFHPADTRVFNIGIHLLLFAHKEPRVADLNELIELIPGPAHHAGRRYKGFTARHVGNDQWLMVRNGNW